MFCISDDWDDQKIKIEAGKALRKARKSRNFTQEKIEEKVDRYKNAFTNYENGNTSMDFVTLVRTVSALQMDVNEIFPFLKPVNKEKEPYSQKSVLDICRKLPREEQMQIVIALMRDNWMKDSEINRM